MIFTQLNIVYTWLTHAFILKQEEWLKYTCGKIITIKHILLECKKLVPVKKEFLLGKKPYRTFSTWVITGHSLGKFYLSAEMQSVYSTAPARFCTNSHIPLIIICIFILMQEINSSLSAVLVAVLWHINSCGLFNVKPFFLYVHNL